MPLLIAIEPDKRHAGFIQEQARERLRADLIVTDSVDGALEAIRKEVPDLILTSLLLSPKDEARLQEQLRQLDGLGIHVQTLVIPVMCEPAEEPPPSGGMLSRLRKRRPPTAEGCDPAVFGTQIAEYLGNAPKIRTPQTDATASTRAAEASGREAPAGDGLPEPVREETSVPEGPRGRKKAAALVAPAPPVEPHAQSETHAPTLQSWLKDAVPSLLNDVDEASVSGFAPVDAIIIDDPPTAESIAQLLEELKPVASATPSPRAEPVAPGSLVDSDILDVFDDADRVWRPRRALVIETNEYDSATLLGFFADAAPDVTEGGAPAWLLAGSPSRDGSEAGGVDVAALRHELEQLRHSVARQV